MSVCPHIFETPLPGVNYFSPDTDNYTSPLLPWVDVPVEVHALSDEGSLARTKSWVGLGTAAR